MAEKLHEMALGCNRHFSKKPWISPLMPDKVIGMGKKKLYFSHPVLIVLESTVFLSCESLT